ncbi:MAG: DUF3465 domain-containing protein [Bacteriovorax sp.]|nr:DUF3465 domain-containing protein [Bacteriovorax sp.]
MKLFIVSSLFILLSVTATAKNVAPVALPECKDLRGSVLPDTVDQLKVVMKSNASRPQVIATGVVSQILPEDHSGLPHQKYTLTVAGQIKLLIVSNLDFGRVPLVLGSTVSVCGEFKKVGQGMIHWTHFDPHGGHPDGFTIVNGALYGDKEIPGFSNN